MKRSSRDFKTYKKYFELLKPLFYIAMKNKLVTILSILSIVSQNDQHC